jgi:hypothetical protein
LHERRRPKGIVYDAIVEYDVNVGDGGVQCLVDGQVEGNGNRVRQAQDHCFLAIEM